MVLELFIIWLGPGQTSSGIVLVSPGTELCSIGIANTVGAKVGLVIVVFVVMLVLVSLVCLLPGIELSISVPNTVSAEAGLITVVFVVATMPDLVVEAVEND